MSDVLQQAMYTFATTSDLARELTVFCAAWLVFVLAAAWLLAMALRRDSISLSLLVRLVALVMLSFLLAKVLNRVIADPRPYLVEHLTPFAPVSRDNGFPSDHTLMAAAFTASFWWIDRRLIIPFALGMLLVMLGRLGIGAHHTLDVVGSVGIVAFVTLLVSLIPLPPQWSRPLLTPRTSRGQPSSHRA